MILTGFSTRSFPVLLVLLVNSFAEFCCKELADFVKVPTCNRTQLAPWIRLHMVLSCVYNGAFVSKDLSTYLNGH